MEATEDRFWLVGNPAWWKLGEGETPPALRDGEIPLSEAWANSSSNKAHWSRQRLRPLAWSLLKPSAWAPFFLISSSFPLAFPGKTPDDQAVAAILFVVSWSLLIIPQMLERNSQPSSGGSILSLPIDWKLLLVGFVIFPLHIEVDPKIGWISYSLFIASMLRSIGLISESFEIPPARLVAPVNPTALDGLVIDGKWTVLSDRWHRGPIATLATENGSLLISGSSRSGFDFISLAYRHQTGFVQDCLFEGHPESEALSEILLSPPVVFEGAEWPSSFILPVVEE